jgi:hypothetical protein
MSIPEKHYTRALALRGRRHLSGARMVEHKFYIDQQLELTAARLIAAPLLSFPAQITLQLPLL